MQKSIKIFLAGALAVLWSVAPARAEPVYAALGASDAIGAGSSAYPQQPNGGYVFRIADWLQVRYAPWSLQNEGMSNYTAPEIRDNQLDPAIAGAPTIVTVWAGGNDIKESILAQESTATLAARFEPAYTEIIRRLRMETDAFIVTANLPDFSRLPVAVWFPPEIKAVGKADSDALNEIIARVAGEYNVPVVDLYNNPASYDGTSYSSDGFHPNDKGYAAMAEAYEAILREHAWRRVSGLGDVDGNGAVAPPDAAETLRVAAGLAAPDDRQAVAADTAPAGGDGTVDVLDALQTIRRAFGLVSAVDWE